MTAHSTATSRATGATRWAIPLLALATALLFLGSTLGASSVSAAKGGKQDSPTLSVLTAARAGGTGVGGPLTVHGENFVPSSGGQMVMLWVGYPDDYCDSSICHGFYAFPNVSDDGTFDMTFDDATVSSGTGTTSAKQYSVRNDKWRTVVRVDYTVQ